MVRFQDLTAASIKMTVFWDVAPCSLVEIDRRFRGVLHRPDDGGSKHCRIATLKISGYIKGGFNVCNHNVIFTDFNM
jgi:hypothetical protein